MLPYAIMINIEHPMVRHVDIKIMLACKQSTKVPFKHNSCKSCIPYVIE